VTLCNNSGFYKNGLLVPHPTIKQEDHPLTSWSQLLIQHVCGCSMHMRSHPPSCICVWQAPEIQQPICHLSVKVDWWSMCLCIKNVINDSLSCVRWRKWIKEYYFCSL